MMMNRGDDAGKEKPNLGTDEKWKGEQNKLVQLPKRTPLISRQKGKVPLPGRNQSSALFHWTTPDKPAGGSRYISRIKRTGA